MSATMKLLAVAPLALRAAAWLQAAGREPLALAAAAGPAGVHYGDSRCPCIGFDNIEGETMLELELKGEKIEVAYPADMGARCEAWDDNRHLQCKAGGRPGSGAGWCAQSWCYVDPCSCDIDVLPKIASLYNTEATYRGKPLFWSYATCGGKDMFTVKLPKLGSPKCRCIGFEGVSGTTEISFGEGKTAEYAADLGSSCLSWDEDVHPDCKGEKAPAWCMANWCYVDPCECELAGGDVPKVSAYLPEASFRGLSLYYSYETCGSADMWTEENHGDACVNQATEEDCGGLPRCGWTGERCLGSELVSHPLCKDAVKKFSSHKQNSGSASSKLSLYQLLVAIAATVAAAMA